VPLPKVGFQDAIVVKQMPDDATWDPEDVRYNTIRWINSIDAAFALGPSRVNPLTGQILDADILIDANFVKFTEGRYRDLVQQTDALPFLPQLFTKLTGNPYTCDTRVRCDRCKVNWQHPKPSQTNCYNLTSLIKLIRSIARSYLKPMKCVLAWQQRKSLPPVAYRCLCCIILCPAARNPRHISISFCVS
jgi:hypothetical protein